MFKVPQISNVAYLVLTANRHKKRVYISNQKIVINNRFIKSLKNYCYILLEKYLKNFLNVIMHIRLLCIYKRSLKYYYIRI